MMKSLITILAVCLSVSFLVPISSCVPIPDEQSPCDCKYEVATTSNYVAGPNNPSGSWSTFEAAGGEFTADATRHAEMYVYFYWLDSARAETSEMPPITPSFESVFGYFNYGSPSSNTVIHVDNQPRKCWSYYKSAAANQSTPEATSYKVGWEYDSSYPQHGEVFVRTSITFKQYDPNQHDRKPTDDCN